MTKKSKQLDNFAQLKNNKMESIEKYNPYYQVRKKLHNLQHKK